MDTQTKKVILQALYDHHERWSSTTPYACEKGCASCCTNSVTMTNIEGEMIHDFLLKNNELGLLQKISKKETPSSLPSVTTNEFALSCIEEKEVEEHEAWDFIPCFLLKDDSCMIYPARPFGCRSFVSKKRCNAATPAEVSSATFTVNTMMMQIIEHLDQGNPWGNMLMVLRRIIGENSLELNDNKENILTSKTNPGFLVPPEDTEVAEKFLQDILNMKIADKTLGQIFMK